MTGIKAPRIENKRQDDITKNMLDDYHNYETYKGYDRETLELGKAHLGKMKNKIDDAIKQLNQDGKLKEKFPEKYNSFAQKFQSYQTEIENSTRGLGNYSYHFHHKETINKLGSIVDNYENDAIKLISELVEEMGDAEIVEEERGKIEAANEKVKYLELGEDGIYTMTKSANKPKIDKVLGEVMNPGETWMIDYSGCTNESIKNRMINAMSKSEQFGEEAKQVTSCYLTYNDEKKTYVLSDGDGNKLDQRALIWEGVRITPPSKIRLEAKAELKERQKAQMEKFMNKELTDKDKEELFDLMPEKMRNKLKQTNYEEFFRITEESMNERIKEAKMEGYELAADPIGNPTFGTKSGYILELRLINGNAETEKPLIKDEFSKEVKKAFRYSDLDKYLTARIQTKWREFDYLTKKGSVIEAKDNDSSEVIDDNKKLFALKGLSMLGSWAEAVSEKIGDSRLKDDDREFAGIKNLIRDAENDINMNSITMNDLHTIENKLSEKIAKYFKNNLRSLFQINSSDVAGYIKDIISSGDKEKQIVALRGMGASRTWFDNTETTFLRDEILDEFNKKKRKQKVKKDENGEIMLDENGKPIYETDDNGNPIYEVDENGNPVYETDEDGDFVYENTFDLKDDSYEVYFENINKLYQIDPSEIGEDGELPQGKKEAIDELYDQARTCTGKHGVKNFKAFLISKGLIPDGGHGGQLDDKVKALKTQLEQQEKFANKFEVTGNDIRERTKQKLAELKLSLSSSQIKAAEQGDDGRNDEGIARLNALNFMVQQDDSFFQNIAEEETTNTRKSIKYGQVDGIVRGNLAPYIVRRGGGINGSSKMAEIYNDSVGAGGWFDFSDEGAEKTGPMLINIITEVVITAVSICLSWNGAGEAIYVAYREAKVAVAALKGLKKIIQFMKVFAKTLLKTFLTQFAGKFKVGATQIGKHAIGGGKAAASIIDGVKTAREIGELGKRGHLAIKGTSLVVSGTTFHINSTVIHNLMNGEYIGKGLNPFGYEVGPNGEHISNREGYARTIAFLGILQGTGKIIGNITGKAFSKLDAKALESAAKDIYRPSTVNKILKSSLALGGEMGSLMATDQILSLTFDQSLKPITGEDLAMMFGMIVGLKLNSKFQIWIKEHNGAKTKLEMVQEGTGNKFNVTLDKEGNVLKVEGVDAQGNTIKNPEQVSGITSGDRGMNMRTERPNQTGTIEGGSHARKNLNRLNTGDEISIKRGENTVKFEKTADGKRVVTDSGGSNIAQGTEYEIEKNPNDNSYHLKPKEGKGNISLDGQINVKLSGNPGTVAPSGNNTTESGVVETNNNNKNTTEKTETKNTGNKDGGNKNETNESKETNETNETSRLDIEELQKKYNELENKLKWIEGEIEMDAESEIRDETKSMELTKVKNDLDKTAAQLMEEVEKADKQAELDALNFAQHIDTQTRD